jgi:nucleotide-binding universal stress UspA family protein
MHERLSDRCGRHGRLRFVAARGGTGRRDRLRVGRQADRGDGVLPQDQRAADVLKDEGYKMSGNAPIYAILREARDRAKAAGANDVEEKAIVGAPVDALVDLASEVNADLLVVGNVGLSTIAGRLLGSVPANVARRSKTDVLIVHTS